MNDRVISEKEMVESLREEAERFLRTDLYTLHVSREKMNWIEEQKRTLRRAMDGCAQAQPEAWQEMLTFVTNCLEATWFSEENFWQRVWAFRNETETSDIITQKELFFCYKRYGAKGFSKWTEQQNRRKTFFFADEKEKKEFLANLLCREAFGLGKVALLFLFAIDGISCGISSFDRKYPIWVMFEGNSIALPQLTLHEEELKRICKLLAAACGEGEFHAERGYCIGDLKNHIRTVILRPPFAEGWTFFLRKYDSVSNRTPEDLIQGNGAKEAHRLLRLMVKGNQTFGITGMQGSGKTTLLMSLIGEIPQEYTLRILEQVFELHIKDLYPDRNVLTIRETERISGQEGLSVLKKTDGHVTIVGEVADTRVAAWMIDAGQAASLFTIFTHHAKTTHALVHALRNSLLSEGIFSKERIAEEQVVEVLRFCVHLVRDRNGRRYLSQITEICPLYEETEETFVVKTLLQYRNGKYVRTHAISEATLEEIGVALSEEEKLTLEFEKECEWSRKERANA